MMRSILYTAGCLAAFCAFPAAAATVVPFAGDVFVSQGDGFRKITGATQVKVGDSVMVSPKGLAQVQLDDGNIVTVSPGEVLNVPAKARAKDAALPGGAAATQADNGGNAAGGAIGVGLAAIGLAGAAALAASSPAPASP
jgi:hypothetical protein